ncbi:hypothetical protein MXB_5325, partial [Myxobolus squamalis]
GSQFCKLIDRIVREQCVETVISPLSITHLDVQEKKFKSIIISGGPASLSLDAELCIDEKIFDLGIPILGICFGMQLIVKKFGGKVEKLDYREDAETEVNIVDSCYLYT